MHHDSGERPGKGKNRHSTPAGSHTPLDAVRQLLAEKAKFEKWLTDLDAKRATTPERVFDRVRADYSGRLHGVLEKLKEHTSTLRQHASALAAKLEQLTESEQGILDTRAESELRAEVGELSASDWERTSKKLERDLAKIKQDQALIVSDLDDLRAILGGIEAPAGAGIRQPSTPPGAVAEPVSGAEQSVSPAATPAGNVDELAFLKSVIGTTPAEPVRTADRPDGAKPEAAKPESPTPAAPADPASPVPAPNPLVEPPAAGPVLKSKFGSKPLADRVTGANPIVLRTSGVMEQPKTLKCGECGAMNYPSEWYCERCGAELTNV